MINKILKQTLEKGCTFTHMDGNPKKVNTKSWTKFDKTIENIVHYAKATRKVVFDMVGGPTVAVLLLAAVL